MTGRKWWIGSLFAGVLFVASYDISFLWPLAFVGFGFFLTLVRKIQPIQAFASGLITFSPVVLWIVWSIERSYLPMENFFVAMIGGGFIALTWAVFAGLVSLSPLGGFLEYFLIAGSFCGLEYLRAQAYGILTLFGPYLLVGHTQVTSSNPLFGAADLVGVGGLSGFVVIGGIFFAHRLERRPISRLDVLAVIILLGASAYGIVRERTLAPGRPLTVAVLGSEIPPGDPQLDSYEAFKRLKLEFDHLTRDAVAQGAQIVIWPEQAVPFALRTFDPAREWLQTLSDETGAELIVGGRGAVRNGFGVWEITNNAFLFSPNSPFPLDRPKLFIPPMTTGQIWERPIDLKNATSLDGRPVSTGINLPTQFGLVASPICFEAILTDLVGSAVDEGAEVFAIMSNDAVFARTAGFRQTLRHMIGRSVEYRRWICRATNCGYSLFVDPSGAIIGKPALGSQSLRVMTVECRTDHTVYEYARKPLSVFAVMCLATLVLCAVIRRLPFLPRRMK